jgi:hypothetical protein
VTFTLKRSGTRTALLLVDRRALTKALGRRARSIRATLRLTITPAGGKPVTATRAIVVRR